MASEQKLTVEPPGVVAELGPGDSLGTGIAALISGCSAYHAFDAARHANTEGNLRVFDELVPLFQRQEAIPDETEFPKMKPPLKSYAFPSEVLSRDRLRTALEPKRLEAIRAAIQGMTIEGKQSELISYVAPWSTMDPHQESSVDMIFSQAVMEHVEDLEGSYQSMHKWLKPGGLISHEIDFKCHNTANRWNGHWAYSKFLWACVKGTRSYFINRAPLSTHLALLKESGFDIVHSCITENKGGIAREELSREFADMSDSDFITSTVFLQGRRN
jgi:SAM-dependent methyltransferase